jgi:monoterpene epsilon-lactone hydrolase
MNDQPQRATGVKVGAKFVPFPTSISPQAQAYLANLVQADGSPHPRPPSPAPDDLEGWLRAKAGVGEMMMNLYRSRGAQPASSSETTELGGAVVYVATPADAKDDRCAYLDIHGGGLVHGGGEPCRMGGRFVADLHRVRTYSVDYRMPPQHPYPASLDDCVAAYRALLDRHEARRIVIGGASAGGNLAAATVLRARDEGLPLPAGLVLLTPELDLTESGDSFETNAVVDLMLPARLTASNELYAAGADLAHPYLSPLFGDFTKGYPPTFVQAGTRDLFLSNAARMHRALRAAKVPVELHIFEGMPHGGFGDSPEDHDLREETRRFVAECLA